MTDEVAERVGATLVRKLRIPEWRRGRYMTEDGVKSNQGLARLAALIIDEETAK